MKIINAILGILTLSNGWSVYNDPIWCAWYYERCVDFTGYNQEAGIFLMFLGVCILYITYRYRAQKEETYICPKCLKPTEVVAEKNPQCTKCKVKLEPVKGFYDRHPELRDKE